MPPKKAKNKNAGPIDDVNTTSMTREQLEAYVHRLKNELEREREERNFFQVERDKIRSFWEITRNRLDDEKQKVHTKDLELEIPTQNAENIVRENIRKMKYLEYENHKKLGDIHLKIMQANFNPDMEILSEIGELRKLSSEKDETYHLRVEQLKMANSEEISRMQQNFKNQELELRAATKEKINLIEDNLRKKHQIQLNETVQRKDEQIKQLISLTDKEFEKIKEFYEQRTSKHLFLIDVLKGQTKSLQKEIKEIQSQADDAVFKNKMLNTALDHVEVAFTNFNEINENLSYCKKENIRLSEHKIRLQKITKQLNQQKLENDALLMLKDKISEERDLLKMQLEELSVRMKNNVKFENALLEKHIMNLMYEAKNSKRNLNELFRNENSIDMKKLNSEINNLVQIQDEIIQNLQCEIIKMKQIYGDSMSFRKKECGGGDQPNNVEII